MIEEEVTKALRVFYRKSTNDILWTLTIEDFKQRDIVPFSNTIEEDLAKLPDTMPDGITPLGGVPEDYDCVEIQETETVNKILDSDVNRIDKGKVIFGAPRMKPEPEPPEDLAAKIANLEARLDKAGIPRNDNGTR